MNTEQESLRFIKEKRMQPVVRLKKMRIYPCGECESIYISANELVEHSKSHIHMFSTQVKLDKLNVLKCRSCSRGFLSNRECKLHELMHVEKINIKTNTTQPTVTQDEDSNEIVKIFKCEDCDAVFALYSTLIAHSMLHQPFPHVCECGIGYYREQDYYGHRRLVHKDNFKWPLRIKTKTIHIPKTEIEDKDYDSDNYPYYEMVKPEPEYKPKIKREPQVTKKNKKRKHKPKKTKKKGFVTLLSEMNEEIYVTKNENGKYECPVCSIAYYGRANHFITHYCGHTGATPYICNPCGTQFIDKEHRANHMKTHILFECQYCDKSFTGKTYLAAHTRVHTGERPFACHLCDKRFTQNAALKTHLQTHSTTKNHICQYCKKAFGTYGTRLRHEQTHSKVRPYLCSYCNKSFIDPSAYQRHIRTHTGDKRYKCKVCPMAFSDASGLIAHRKRHGERSLNCDICEKQFYLTCDLRKHLLIVHAKQRNFECNYCGNKFTTKSNLKLHILNHHSKVVLECKKCKVKFGSKFLYNEHKSRCTDVRRPRLKYGSVAAPLEE